MRSVLLFFALLRGQRSVAIDCRVLEREVGQDEGVGVIGTEGLPTPEALDMAAGGLDLTVDMPGRFR